MGNHPWLQAAIWAQDFVFRAPFPKKPSTNPGWQQQLRWWNSRRMRKNVANLRSTREALGKWTTVDGSGTCTTWHISSPLIGSIVPQTSYSHVIIIKSLGEIVHPLDISSCRTVGVSPNLLILIRSPDRLSYQFHDALHDALKAHPYWKSSQGHPNPNISSLMFKTKRQELST